ncbi:Uncharacterized protein APZ42_023241 [Daphnia magna]|uniref:Uncharacterized protein n=1 Tax=Daphnia magna TaxID=35525 RepID=A0A164V420_9CRUS|nr:Uncharacterized protein APZ42_023241 [Daphnia magna]
MAVEEKRDEKKSKQWQRHCTPFLFSSSRSPFTMSLVCPNVSSQWEFLPFIFFLICVFKLPRKSHKS